MDEMNSRFASDLLDFTALGAIEAAEHNLDGSNDLSGLLGDAGLGFETDPAQQEAIEAEQAYYAENGNELELPEATDWLF